VVEIPGYRPTIRLAAAFADVVTDRAWWSPDETTPVVLELLQGAEDLETSRFEGAMLEEAKGRVVSALNTVLGDWSAREQRLDHARREQQYTALRTTLEFRVQRAGARLAHLEQRQAADFPIRMARAQFDRARQQLEIAVAQAPSTTWPGVEQEEIAVGVLRVGGAT